MEATKEKMVNYLEQLIKEIHFNVYKNEDSDELESKVIMDVNDLTMLGIIKNEISKL